MVGLDDSAKGLRGHTVTSQSFVQRQNRYLVRELCWVMNIEGLETYIVLPRDSADFDLRIESIRMRPQTTDLESRGWREGAYCPSRTMQRATTPDRYR